MREQLLLRQMQQILVFYTLQQRTFWVGTLLCIRASPRQREAVCGAAVIAPAPATALLRRAITQRRHRLDDGACDGRLPRLKLAKHLGAVVVDLKRARVHQVALDHVAQKPSADEQRQLVFLDPVQQVVCLYKKGFLSHVTVMCGPRWPTNHHTTPGCRGVWVRESWPPGTLQPGQTR